MLQFKTVFYCRDNKFNQDLNTGLKLIDKAKAVAQML